MREGYWAHVDRVAKVLRVNRNRALEAIIHRDMGLPGIPPDLRRAQVDSVHSDGGDQ